MDRDQLNASTELLKLLLEVKTWQQQQEEEESRCLVHCVYVLLHIKLDKHEGFIVYKKTLNIVHLKFWQNTIIDTGHKYGKII